MPRYIDADALIAFIDIGHSRHPSELCFSELDIVNMLNHAPSVDVRPVIRGKWIESTIPNEQYVCSVCGGACWYYDFMGSVAKSKFCPNCGADLRQIGGDTE